jgi:hypothetical protein
MADVTTGPQGVSLRPEDATTLEEFQARRDGELARIRAVRRSRRNQAQYAGVIAGFMLGGASWYWFWHSSGILLRLAIVALILGYNYVLGRIANRVTWSKRRRELDRLSVQWQARVGS